MSENIITINDVINELKRLQVEHGNIEAVTLIGTEPINARAAWPEYNEDKNRIEF
jgi:hypothetical protein